MSSTNAPVWPKPASCGYTDKYLGTIAGVDFYNCSRQYRTLVVYGEGNRYFLLSEDEIAEGIDPSEYLPLKQVSKADFFALFHHKQASPKSTLNYVIAGTGGGNTFTGWTSAQGGVVTHALQGQRTVQEAQPLIADPAIMFDNLMDELRTLQANPQERG